MFIIFKTLFIMVAIVAITTIVGNFVEIKIKNYFNNRKHKHEYLKSDGSGEVHRIEYYKGNNLHREDGPAVKYYNGYDEWWLNDKCLFEKLCNGYIMIYTNKRKYDPFIFEQIYLLNKENGHSK